MSYWNNNLRLLEQKDPSLAEYISKVKSPKDIVALKSKSGLPTIKRVNSLGYEKFLISPIDPVSEAQKLVDNFSFNGEDGTILFGFGLGYLVKEISKKKDPRHVLYVVEGVPELFKLAMRYTDLSEIILNDNTYFYVGHKMFTILDNFVPIQAKSITGTINKLAIPSLRKLCEKKYDALDKQIDNYVTFLKKSYASFNYSKELRLANLFQNIPSMLNSSPANHLKNCVKNRPTFIVAAGPSLNQDIKILGNRLENSLVICVDAALKPLLVRGIIPDLVVTCDPYPKNYNKVEGLSKEWLGQIPLIYPGEATPQVIEKFSGYKFIVNAHNSLTQWLTNIGRNIVTFPFFPSVSHLGFITARYMGADPIIFVGLDLSFPVDQEHGDGCAQTWKLDFNNTEFIWVPNNTGGKVKTIPSFLSMIHSFEYEINKTKARCINVSRGGAMIKGAEWMPLEDVFKLNKSKRLNDKREGVNSNTDELKNGVSDKGSPVSFGKIIEENFIVKSEPLREHYSNALAWLISEVEAISSLCLETNTLLDSSRLNTDYKDENEQRLKKLCALYRSSLKHKDLLTLLADYLSQYMMSRCKNQIGGGAKDSRSHKTEDLELMAIFFEELIPSIILLEKHCRQVFVNIRK